MIPLLVLGLVGLATAGMVALRKPAGTVYPFAPTTPTAADTLTAAGDTVLADDGWQSVTLARLSDVEDLLDSLEAHHVRHREVRCLGNNAFCVRWR